MAKRKIEDELLQLSHLRQSAPDLATAALRKALADRVNLIAAKAAKMTAELRLAALTPDLLASFDRFFPEGKYLDPQCSAKNAIAQALVTLDYAESVPFLRGVSYSQLEPVWGGHEDTAIELRCICTLALVQCTDLRRVEVLRILVDRFADNSRVRSEAARALAQMGGDDSVLLLRLKARLGDQEPVVTGSVLESLMRVEGDRATSFVAEFLAATDEQVREEAALALGASRLPGALAELLEAFRSARKAANPVLLRAIASSRLDESFAFLLELIRKGHQRDASDALDALSLHRDSEELCRRVKEAVTASAHQDLQREFEKRFPAC